MRQAFLWFLIFLAGCALPRPTSWRPNPASWTGAQGEVRYEVISPKGRLTGRGRFLASPDFFYLEALSPFGFALAQGLIYGVEARLVVFSQRSFYRLRLEGGKPLSCCWGSLFLGRFPGVWLKGALVLEEKKGYLLRKDLGGLFLTAFFDRKGKLLSLRVGRERTLLFLRYPKEGQVELEIPPLRSKVRLYLAEVKERGPLPPPEVGKPYGFQEYFYRLEF